MKKCTNKKLARIRPSRLIEPLNSNPLLILKQAFVNYIRSLLTMLRNNVIRWKPLCCCFQLFPTKLSKSWQWIFLSILCKTHKLKSSTKRHLFYKNYSFKKKRSRKQTQIRCLKNRGFEVWTPQTEREFWATSSHFLYFICRRNKQILQSHLVECEWIGIDEGENIFDWFCGSKNCKKCVLLVKEEFFFLFFFNFWRFGEYFHHSWWSNMHYIWEKHGVGVSVCGIISIIINRHYVFSCVFTLFNSAAVFKTCVCLH